MLGSSKLLKLGWARLNVVLSDICSAQRSKSLTKIFLEHKFGDLGQMLGLQLLRQGQLISHGATFRLML